MYFGVGENAGTSTCTCSFYLHLSQPTSFPIQKRGRTTIPTSKKSLISMANRFMTRMPKYAHLNRRNRQLRTLLFARPRGQNGRTSTSWRGWWYCHDSTSNASSLPDTIAATRGKNPPPVPPYNIIIGWCEVLSHRAASSSVRFAAVGYQARCWNDDASFDATHHRRRWSGFAKIASRNCGTIILPLPAKDSNEVFFFL